MLDWDDLRFVLAVARGGTLSAAARALATTQPTVGRRISAFEEAVGARLFHRQPTGYVPTAAGHAVIANLERMEREALDAERLLSGRDVGVRGTVRITTSEWLVVRVLGPAVAGLVAGHPSLTIDVIAEPRHVNLTRRESDLAIRPRAFEHQDVYQRRLARLELGLYASPGYLAAHGAPSFAAGCAGHTFIGLHDEINDIAQPWISAMAAAARIAVRTNGREQMATIAAAGAGLACLPRLVGDSHAGLRRLAVPRPLPERVLWLGIHRDARAIPRVRTVSSFLVEELRRLQPALAPGT
ncbi:MAG TPA: LysR family transcriptional regulator [Kofleriaceae bacterium]|nr:LysR family transcriptional regulator [Kofleriaceae bacterium]